MNLEQLGLLGVFIAGAIPWFEAIAVIPSGIVLGLNPIATVISAIAGNLITIFIFAYAGSGIRAWLANRRLAKNKAGESKKFTKAIKAMDKYGIYGMALLGPIFVGTQFAAAAAVAIGIKPLRAAVIISTAMVFWAIVLAVIFVKFEVNLNLV
jgi:Ca2+/H+ antiporter, TMEM165/GDT1 family